MTKTKKRLFFVGQTETQCGAKISTTTKTYRLFLLEPAMDVIDDVVLGLAK